MMKNLEIEDKKVAVLGMGIEGVALVDFLIDKGCKISVLDKFTTEELLKNNPEPEKINEIIANDNIEKVFGENYLDNLSNFDIIFRSPGISYLNPKIVEAKKIGVEISSQIKLFFQLCPCKIIGVTGTKGKGTTASLIYEIIKKKFQNQNDKLQIKSKIPNSNEQNNWKLEIGNWKFQPNVYLAGNIGYPAITLAPKLKPDDIVVLELSSFQLMDLEASPHIAVVTNLFIDHLDYHSDEKEYRTAKENIVKFQTNGNFAVLNRNSTFDSQVIKNTKSNIKYFVSAGLDSRFRGNDNKESGSGKEDITLNGGAIVTDDSVTLDPQNRKIEICNLSEIKLFGHHNLENIAAASLVADILGINPDTIRDAVREFKGLPYRIEFVAEIDGVKFINDSFATNPEPTKAAIDSFSEDKILILGGSSKGADFSDLAQKISGTYIKGVVLIGDEADKIEQALAAVAFKGQTRKGFSDMVSIVKVAQELSSAGNVVILSPACASFGLFKNYKDRGDKFKTAVLNLKSEIQISKSK